MKPGPYPKSLVLPATTVVMMPGAMAVMIVMVVINADPSADMQAANMDAGADFCGSRGGTEQTQGQQCRHDQFLHDKYPSWHYGASCTGNAP